MLAERSLAKGRYAQTVRAERKLRRFELVDKEAKDEIRMYLGEPSAAFYPPDFSGNTDNVIFLSEARKRKERRNYRGTIATKEDIENRIREQLETCVVVQHLGQMTPQWRRYMFNHAEEVFALMG